MAETFLNAVTEAINENGEGRSCKDILVQKISYKVVDRKEERDLFTWPDKKYVLFFWQMCRSAKPSARMNSL